ncbi:MAG: GIY-YIG nuclease family protein [Rhizobiaceae bacterium]|nr:GIY-YIG nuclease family protein [Rhizobiaceae bacterium]
MAVYFFTEEDDTHPDRPPVKIGFSKNISRRKANLQTGNPRPIALMGYIESSGESEDRVIEKNLHQKYQPIRRGKTEWFDIYPEDVITALNMYSSRAYIVVASNAFEIISYDYDGIPEYANSWNWGDLNPNEFCPACGWACGWTYSENWGCEYCLKCGANEINYGDGRN